MGSLISVRLEVVIGAFGFFEEWLPASESLNRLAAAIETRKNTARNSKAGAPQLCSTHTGAEAKASVAQHLLLVEFPLGSGGLDEGLIRAFRV